MEEKLRFVFEYQQRERSMTELWRSMESHARPGMCGCGDIGRRVGKDFWSKVEGRGARLNDIAKIAGIAKIAKLKSKPLSPDQRG
jgi:hypothetical protein